MGRFMFAEVGWKLQGVGRKYHKFWFCLNIKSYYKIIIFIHMCVYITNKYKKLIQLRNYKNIIVV